MLTVRHLDEIEATPRVLWARKYREANKEHVSNYHKQYRARHPELRAERKAYAAEYNQLPEVKERRRLQRIARRAERNKLLLARYHSDPNYKLAVNMRTRINIAIKGMRKSLPTLKVLGCTFDELRSYIESKWLAGMSWDNYSRRGWHVDHIRPCASFDLSKPEEFKQCFHYTNLQPMWSHDNLSKNDSYTA